MLLAMMGGMRVTARLVIGVGVLVVGTRRLWRVVGAGEVGFGEVGFSEVEFGSGRKTP